VPYIRRAIEQYSGKNLKGRRELALLSQQELAARVGVTRETISYWETDKRVPSLTNARRLRDVLYFAYALLEAQILQAIYVAGLDRL
jgi:transcriptional regulator with XRE-family HTH domain